MNKYHLAMQVQHVPVCHFRFLYEFIDKVYILFQTLNFKSTRPYISIYTRISAST